MASYTAVYLDLETTGLSVQQADVIQIGATCGHKKFSRYILPTVPIEAGASDTNGLTICEGRLYKGNQPVPTVSMEQAYEELVTFLSGFPNRVIIVAHNGSKFDFRLLARDLKRVGLLGQLRAAVAGTVDSVPVFQAKLPHWGKYEFRLANMVNRLGVSGHGAHDALRDAEMLEALSQKLNVSVSDLWPYLQPL